MLDHNQNGSSNKRQKMSTHPPSAPTSSPMDVDAEIGRMHRVAFPDVPSQRLAAVYKRYGHIPIREKEFERIGCSIYWKTDRRWVNQGTCFYNQATDVYYMRSASRNEGEVNPNEVAWLDIERRKVDSRYTHLTFYVTPPLTDRMQKKIVPCEVHQRDHRSTTFLGIKAVEVKSPPQVFHEPNYDLFQFDISEYSDPILSFQVQFYCWTVCKRMYFSNKKDNLVFHAVFSGSNMPNLPLSCLINIQQNPGRGSNSTVKKKATTIANFNSHWAKNSAQILQDMRNRSGTEGVVSVHEAIDSVEVRILTPPNFRLILGHSQTEMVFEEIKRDVQFIVEGRLNDAISRRPLSNPELMKRKEELEAENRQLREMNKKLAATAREACQMNEDITRGIFGGENIDNIIKSSEPLKTAASSSPQSLATRINPTANASTLIVD